VIVAPRPLVRIDAGWLFVIGGLAMLVAVVLLPGRRAVHEMREQLRVIKDQEIYAYQRLNAHEEFLAGLRSGDQQIIRRLAASHLNLVPEGETAIMLAASLDQTVPDWIDETVPFEASRPGPYPDTLLIRLAEGRHRLWLLCGSVLVIFFGLIMGPDFDSRPKRLPVSQEADGEGDGTAAGPRDDAHPLDPREDADRQGAPQAVLTRQRGVGDALGGLALAGPAGVLASERRWQPAARVEGTEQQVDEQADRSALDSAVEDESDLRELEQEELDGEVAAEEEEEGTEAVLDDTDAEDRDEEEEPEEIAALAIESVEDELELEGIELEEAEVEEAGGAAAELEDAELEDAELEDAEVEDAEVEDAELEDAELEDAELEDAELEDAELEDAELEDAELEHAELGESAEDDCAGEKDPLAEAESDALEPVEHAAAMEEIISLHTEDSVPFEWDELDSVERDGDPDEPWKG
jgi:hypothetical protein